MTKEQIKKYFTKVFKNIWDRFNYHIFFTDEENYLNIMDYHTFVRVYFYDDNLEDKNIHHFYISDLSVEEGFRREGRATNMLNHIEAIAKQCKITELYLKVDKDSWMHEWYLRRGFRDYTLDEENYIWLQKLLETKDSGKED